MNQKHYRTGIGYDVHQFADGRKCILGGVDIPCEFGLLGHSDADVLCHAIADALLGAVGLPDIGHFFPPSNPLIEGISSLEILRKVGQELALLGAEIINIDSTLIAETPKILAHVGAMKANIGEALGVRTDQIGIKATTNETMGFVGRKEGIAAISSASVLK